MDKWGTLLLKALDWKGFAISLLLAASLWAFTKLSASYEQTMHLPVNYVNLPSNQTTDENTFLDITLRASGWQWMLRSQPTSFTIDISKALKRPEWPMIAVGKDVSKAFGYAKVVSYEPRVLTPRLERMADTTLAVEVDVQEALPDNFFIRGSITVDPPQVDVYGSGEKLRTLPHIQTEAISVEHSEGWTGKVALLSEDGIVPSPDSVRVTIQVSEFTEKSWLCTIDLPEDIPDGVVLLQEDVTVKGVVPVDLFDEISPDDFKIIADFHTIEGRKVSRVPLSIENRPRALRNLRLETESVEFLMYEDD